MDSHLIFSKKEVGCRWEVGISFFRIAETVVEHAGVGRYVSTVAVFLVLLNVVRKSEDLIGFVIHSRIMEAGNVLIRPFPMLP